MKVLVGQLIVDERPDVVGLLEEFGSVETFDPWMMTSEIVEVLKRFGPDLILVHQFMLDMSFLLKEFLRLAACEASRVVIACRPITSIVKIETAHAGFHDVIDLDQGADLICGQLRDVSEGRYGLDSDPLWRKVNRPPRLEDIQLLPRDSTDEEILHLISMGLSDNEISEVGYMSPQTIRNRVSQMLIRSGMSNRTQLAWVFTHRNLLQRITLGIERRPTNP